MAPQLAYFRAQGGHVRPEFAERVGHGVDAVHPRAAVVVLVEVLMGADAVSDRERGRRCHGWGRPSLLLLSLAGARDHGQRLGDLGEKSELVVDLVQPVEHRHSFGRAGARPGSRTAEQEHGQ